MKAPRRTACALFLVVCASGRLPAAERQTQTIEVQGRSPHSYDDAKLDAFRNAIERVAGATVYAKTNVQDFRLLADTVCARAGGYIRRVVGSPVIEERDGLYTVTLTVEVAVGEVELDLGEIDLLLKTRRPKVLVLVEEIAEGVRPPGKTVERSLQQLLLEHRIRTVDAEMLKKIGDRDKLKAEILGDPRKAAAIGLRVGATHVVRGEADVRAASKKPKKLSRFYPEPLPENVVETVLDLSIIETDTAIIGGSASATEAAAGGASHAAYARTTLRAAAQQAGQKALQMLLKHWSREIYEGHTVQCIGTRIDTEVLHALVARLNRLPRVSSVHQNRHDEDFETDLTINGRLTTPSLAREIEQLSGQRLKVKAFSRNRIDFVMRAADAQRPDSSKRRPPGSASDHGAAAKDSQDQSSVAQSATPWVMGGFGAVAVALTGLLAARRAARRG